tara:strand:- start:1135 stop:2337 length:1203 start_codon:yes stop_codon:yes gene_type:complete
MSEQVKQEGTFKIKKRPKKLVKNDEPIKVDLSKINEPKKEEKDAVQVGETKKVVVAEQAGDSPQVDKQVSEPSKVSETKEEKEPIIQEIVEEEKPIETKVEEEIVELGEKIEEKVIAPTPEEAREVAKLPENIEKVVDFMKETGGTLEDYVRLNADYSNIDNDTLLREYYKQAKSHLNSEEVNFMIEDNFSFDEEVDEERDIRKKKLAYKEEVAKAKQHLEGLKNQYYEEIKLRPGVTQDQQKAMDFFNRYNEEQNTAQQQHEDFKSNTKDYFSNEFKGFDFNIGEKKFRYGVKSPNDVATKQSNITNTIKRFLDDKGNVKDVKGYHKAMYAADNVDKIAQHFYEQGKSDATKDLVAKSKNITEEVRPAPAGEVFVGGLKVKAISGLDSSKLKIKTRKFN